MAASASEWSVCAGLAAVGPCLVEGYGDDGGVVGGGSGGQRRQAMAVDLDTVGGARRTCMCGMRRVRTQGHYMPTAMPMPMPMQRE